MKVNLTPTKLFYLFFLLCNFNFLFSQGPLLEFHPVLGDKIDVVDVVNAGDGSNRLFLVNLSGHIQVYSQSFNYLGEFLTVPSVNTSGLERGLYSIAFHPDYEINGYFFIYYTGGPNGDLILARYKRSATDPNLADPNSRVVLLSIPKPITLSPPFEPDRTHNGGKLNFGPDGNLYFATGDGGSGYDVYGNAENGNSLFGKILRIDVDSETPPYYTIPPDNPFVNNPNMRGEIWAMGLRNPFRWSFDKLTHDIWLGDVGQRDREEVNFIPAGTPGGKSFGWHCFEGSIRTPTVPQCTSANYMPPVFDYSHNGSTGGQAVIGGYVYRGSEFPSLNGYYICGDFSSKNAWLIKKNNLNGLWDVQFRQGILPSSIFSFGEAENGTLYITGNDGIFKVAVSAALPVKLVSFTVTRVSNRNVVRWKTVAETNLKEFVLEVSEDGVFFHDAFKTSSSGNVGGSNYSINHPAPGNQRTYYRLRLVDKDGALTYSNIISTIGKGEDDAIKIYPTVSNGQRIQVQLNESFKSLQVFNIHGQLVFQVDPGPGVGIIFLEVKNWRKGMYALIGRNDQDQQKAIFTLQ